MNSKDLWNLPPEKFNSLRKKKDLPFLFKIFNKELEKFDYWLKDNNLTYNDFLDAPHTGDLFTGEREKEYVRFLRNKEKKVAISASFDEEYEFYKKYEDIVEIEKKKFIPYLIWAQKKLGIDYTEKFKYTHWEGSHAYLFYPLHRVFNLSGIKMPINLMQNRNLDFTCLDKLSLYGGGNQEIKINFSSCCDWNIELEENRSCSLYFSNSNIAFLKINNSSIFIHAKESSLKEPYFKKTDINGFEIKNCSLDHPVFESCNIIPYNFSYIQNKNWLGEEENYRRFSLVFKQNGHTEISGQCFFQQKRYERKRIASYLLEKTKNKNR
ncbi:hypothetical protein VU13_03585 [Desulfobulbus sp. US5]|nr:hypothetical protein [Desulfobulbus sp. US5]